MPNDNDTGTIELNIYLLTVVP